MMLWKCYAHLGTGPKILVMINGQTHAFGTLMLIYIKNKKKHMPPIVHPAPMERKPRVGEGFCGSEFSLVRHWGQSIRAALVALQGGVSTWVGQRDLLIGCSQGE